MNQMKFVAFGDSVMWGQGLKSQHKFVYKASQAISAIEGRQFRLTNNAHSGAVIEAGPSQRQQFLDRFPYLFRNENDRKAFKAGKSEYMTRFQGEIPSSFPTITNQVDSFTPASALTTDVVYLDGGANDADFVHFLDPGNMNFSADNDLLKQIMQERLQGLVERTRAKFPNSLIVLIGFYPIMSERSSKQLMRWLAYWKKVYEGDKNWSEIAFNENIYEVVDVDGETSKMVRRVQNAFNYASYEIRNLVEKLADPNLIFCEPKFNSDNSLFAPNSCVHRGFMLEGENVVSIPGLPDSTLGGPSEMVHDEVFASRKVTMDRYYDRFKSEHGPGIDAELAKWGKRDFYENGLRTSFLHPNQGGAQLYTNEIVKKYSHWKGLSVREQLIRGHERVTSLREFKERYNSPSDSVRALALNAPVDFIKIEFDANGKFLLTVKVGNATIKLGINGKTYSIRLADDSCFFSQTSFLFSYNTFRKHGIPEFNISDLESLKLVIDTSVKPGIDVLADAKLRSFQGIQMEVDGKLLASVGGVADIRTASINNIFTQVIL